MFKVGDVVKVRTDLIPGNTYGVYFSSPMIVYRNRVARITGIVRGEYYRLDVDSGEWLWADEMLLPMHSAKMEVGSKVLTTTALDTKVIAIVKELSDDGKCLLDVPGFSQEAAQDMLGKNEKGEIFLCDIVPSKPVKVVLTKDVFPFGGKGDTLIGLKNLATSSVYIESRMPFLGNLGKTEYNELEE